MSLPRILALACAAVVGGALAATSPAAADPPASLPGVAPTATQVATWTGDCRVAGTANPVHAVLDAKAVAIAVRRKALAGLERCARAGQVAAQDLVGSLYWMGHALPEALVRRDLAKAELYLSNAAAHGDIRDMAKLAEIALALNQPRAAWTWAQLYGHYAVGAPPASGQALSATAKYAADLIKRTDPGVSGATGRDAAGDAAAFLAYYGPGITAYQRRLAAENPQPGAEARVVQSGRVRMRADGDRPATVLADYLVAIEPDGTVQQAWTIDAFPSPDHARRLRAAVLRTRFTPTDSPALRYQVAHVESNDQRYVLRWNDSSPSQ